MEGREGFTFQRDNAVVGFFLGGILAAGLIFAGAELFHPLGIHPEYVSSIAFLNQLQLGRWALSVTAAAMLFAISGAAAEAVVAAAYNWSQFFGWEWGKDKPRGRTRKFVLTYCVLLFAGFLITFCGANPVVVVEFAVPLSAIGLPLCYLARCWSRATAATWGTSPTVASPTGLGGCTSPCRWRSPSWPFPC